MADGVLTGFAALEAFASFLQPSWSSPGTTAYERRASATFNHFKSLIESATVLSVERVYEDRAGMVALDQVTYYVAADEQVEYFSVGGFSVEAGSVRIREAAPGVWIMVDRWSDDIRIALRSDAPFDLTIWAEDEGDMASGVSEESAEQRAKFLGTDATAHLKPSLLTTFDPMARR